MDKIGTCLWFDGQAEEAVEFYKSVFDGLTVGRTLRWPEGHPEAGAVLTVEFEMGGRSFMALNGGPQYKFTEAVSFVVDCEDQKEVDLYWDKLLAGGGAPSMCGWLKDRFGVSWQVTPKGLVDLLTDPDPGRAQRAMAEMMKQVKLDIDAVRKAADGATKG